MYAPAGVNWSAWYALRKDENRVNIALMRLIDAQFLDAALGSRQMVRHLRRQGYVVRRNESGG